MGKNNRHMKINRQLNYWIPKFLRLTSPLLRIIIQQEDSTFDKISCNVIYLRQKFHSKWFNNDNVLITLRLLSYNLFMKFKCKWTAIPLNNSIQNYCKWIFTISHLYYDFFSIRILSRWTPDDSQWVERTILDLRYYYRIYY